MPNCRFSLHPREWRAFQSFPPAHIRRRLPRRSCQHRRNMWNYGKHSRLSFWYPCRKGRAKMPQYCIWWERRHRRQHNHRQARYTTECRRRHIRRNRWAWRELIHCQAFRSHRMHIFLSLKAPRGALFCVAPCTARRHTVRFPQAHCLLQNWYFQEVCNRQRSDNWVF